VVESFRNTTRGFIELGAFPISDRGRLDRADASAGGSAWRQDADQLIAQCRKARAINTEAHWRDELPSPHG